MTNKQRILQMVERWPDDISYDKALYHLYVLKKIDAGLKDIEAGRVYDDDELDELLERSCNEEEDQSGVVGRVPGGSQAIAKKGRRRGGTKNGQVVRKTPAKIRKRSTS
jgi:hypothetical protein